MEMIKRLFEQRWFWPQDVREDPGFINRIGRVLHWTLVAISAAFFATGAFAVAMNTWGSWNDLEAAFLIMCGCVPTWIVGRGARYIFSGE